MTKEEKLSTFKLAGGNTISEAIAILEATVEGKEIQVFYAGVWQNYLHIHDTAREIDFRKFEYRVKPEPLKQDPAPPKYIKNSQGLYVYPVGLYMQYVKCGCHIARITSWICGENIFTASDLRGCNVIYFSHQMYEDYRWSHDGEHFFRFTACSEKEIDTTITRVCDELKLT